MRFQHFKSKQYRTVGKKMWHSSKLDNVKAEKMIRLLSLDECHIILPTVRYCFDLKCWKRIITIITIQYRFADKPKAFYDCNAGNLGIMNRNLDVCQFFLEKTDQMTHLAHSVRIFCFSFCSLIKISILVILLESELSISEYS